MQDRIHALIRSELWPRELPALTDDATLADLGADSIHCIALSLAIEDAFHIRLGDHDVIGSTTVGEIVGLVEREVSHKEAV